MMRWGECDDQYLLLESQKEFKKDSRRVAIKVRINKRNSQFEQRIRAFRMARQRDRLRSYSALMTSKRFIWTRTARHAR